MPSLSALEDKLVWGQARLLIEGWLKPYGSIPLFSAKCEYSIVGQCGCLPSSLRGFESLYSLIQKSQPSGKANVCKTSISGSIPLPFSISKYNSMVEWLVYIQLAVGSSPTTSTNTGYLIMALYAVWIRETNVRFILS